ncbi:MAG: chemotaxis protein CheX [Thermogutta sp.]|uniref:chemotaxis protein CheX n=1 Tax=Thermogutta sp. TaxID=1962930 RepID=UPI0019A1F5AA|nr:chemotaxis protein CheX [Thermogutta sp.]MBC7351796.1 chemotaxis protein CheX [Thermogutta sp.]GIX02760.1 MAG: chemotaxis protein CheX [Thermogutta sp.]
MRAELINPFMRSLQKTFTTMLNCPVRRTSLAVKEDCRACHEVSGVIGLTGKAVGAVVLSLSKEVALKAASTLLCTEMSEVNEDVLDAVGELTNMVAGGAKAELEEFQLAVSLPNVITGKQHEVHFPSNVVPISIHFTCDWGDLSLEVGLALLPSAEGLSAPREQLLGQST